MEILKAIWNSPFWDSPASAFVVPVVLISFFVLTEYLERRTLRLSRKAFADGWDPAKGTEYRHKWFPWRKCHMCFTSNSPNDKFTPSVFIDIDRWGVREVNAHAFRSRWEEIK